MQQQTLKLLFTTQFLYRNFSYINNPQRIISIVGGRCVHVNRLPNSNNTSVNKQAHGEAALEDEDFTGGVFKIPLYTNTQDELLLKLEQCTTYLEIFDLVRQQSDVLQHQHYVQSILSLWQLIRMDTTNTHTIVVQHNDFELILTKLHEQLPHMNLDELSCCYLYLRKMEVPNVHPLMSAMLIQALTVAQKESLIELPALSRFLVGINTGKDFNIPLVCQYFWPHILAHVHICDSNEAIRLLTICMLNAKQLVCTDTMNVLKERVQQLLDDGILNANTPKALLKLVHFFNMPNWSEHNTKIISELLLLLRTSLANLSDYELRNVCRTFLFQLEPSQLIEPLRLETEKRFQNQPTLDALLNYLGFAKTTQRSALITTLKSLLRSKDVWTEPNASSNFFIAMRSLKIADVNTCNMYWNGVIEEVNSCAENERQTKFQRHAHNYMNFNNNLGGTYRNDDLEKCLCNIAMRTLEGDISSRIPSKFARIAAFVLAYGHTPYSWKKFPNVIISKIISMASQFSIMDCFIISRGIQIAMELRFRHQIPSIVNMQLSVIDNILITCAESHLSGKDDISISELNAIVRTLAIRKSLKNSVIYQKALTKYSELDFDKPDCLNSRVLRDMAFNFNLSNFIIPKALDAICNYVESNSNNISGDTVEKFLMLIYNLGYTTVSTNFLKHASSIIIRDFDIMSGLSVVQSCMALCYLNGMSEELIDKVFCTKFIQRVEDEIQTCYSKATYPDRVQNIIMQLNRTVCLDMPEMNVPWFQQNFIEAQLSKERHSNIKFRDEVKRLLKTLLKGDNFFHCNHTTPYGYQIDFVVYFDRDRKPIPKPLDTNMLQNINKVAILLLKLDAFCENDLTMLRGVESLKIKHLEMMGYKVLHLSEHNWNSKYMSTIGVKLNYLKSLLKISDT